MEIAVDNSFLEIAAILKSKENEEKPGKQDTYISSNRTNLADKAPAKQEKENLQLEEKAGGVQPPALEVRSVDVQVKNDLSEKEAMVGGKESLIQHLYFEIKTKDSIIQQLLEEKGSAIQGSKVLARQMEQISCPGKGKPIVCDCRRAETHAGNHRTERIT